MRCVLSEFREVSQNMSGEGKKKNNKKNMQVAYLKFHNIHKCEVI